MKKEVKYKIILVLMILSLLASLALSFVPIDQACGRFLKAFGGCSVVQTSQYENTFGIKNAHVGLVVFPILAILTLFELKRPRKYQKVMITTGMAIGSILALYFLYVQFFILNTICQYCMVVDFAVLMSMALIIFWDEK